MLRGRNSYLFRLIFYFIAGSLAPVLIVSISVLYLTNYMLQEDLVEKSAVTSKMISQDLDLLVNTYSSVLHSLSQEEELQALLAGFPESTVQDGYSRLYLVASGHSRDAQFHVLSTDGTVRMSTGVIFPEYTLPDMDDWGIFRQASSNAGVVLLSSDKSKDYGSDYAFSMAKAITYRGQKVGYVVVDVKSHAVTNILQNRAAATARNSIVTDQYNYVCVNLLSPSQEGFRGLSSEYRSQIEGGQGSFYYNDEEKERWLVSWHQSPQTGLRVIQQVSSTVVNSSTELLRRIVAGACIISVLLLPLLAYGLIRNLWRPISELTQAMRRVRKDDFTARVELNRTDEIGEMGETFNKMVAHIGRLIQNIEDKQRLLRVAQVEALQAQIKPHFIYNTLDLIKWNAKDGDTESVVNLAVQLGRLMRMTISGNNEFVTVRDETNMLSYYLGIQQRRFADRMDISMEVDEAIGDCLIPRLILQPIVENAIVHGLEEKRSGGVLKITGGREGEYLRFVIEDNGKGMSEEKAAWLLERRDSQVGVSNVHQRAKLYGDSRCGLFIDSRVNEGTMVLLLLREIPHEEAEHECEK